MSYPRHPPREVMMAGLLDVCQRESGRLRRLELSLERENAFLQYPRRARIYVRYAGDRREALITRDTAIVGIDDDSETAYLKIEEAKEQQRREAEYKLFRIFGCVPKGFTVGDGYEAYALLIHPEFKENLPVIRSIYSRFTGYGIMAAPPRLMIADWRL